MPGSSAGIVHYRQRWSPLEGFLLVLRCSRKVYVILVEGRLCYSSKFLIFLNVDLFYLFEMQSYREKKEE